MIFYHLDETGQSLCLESCNKKIYKKFRQGGAKNLDIIYVCPRGYHNMSSEHIFSILALYYAVY